MMEIKANRNVTSASERPTISVLRLIVSTVFTIALSLGNLPAQEPLVPRQVLKEFENVDTFLRQVRIIDTRKLNTHSEIAVFEATASQFEHKSTEGHEAPAHMDQAFGVFILSQKSSPKKLAVFWTPRNLDYNVKIAKVAKDKIEVEGEGATYGDSCMTWIFRIDPQNYQLQKLETLDRGGCNVPEDSP